jgi:two-component system nitrate/nitrite response regulator NarP
MVFPSGVADSAHPLAALTERETEILKALASDRSAGQIAHAFAISPNTLKFHLKNVYQKLGVQSRAQAVARYLSASPQR